jgi:hypothetical protein
VLSGRGLCDELITRPEESYRLCRVVVCDLETSRIGAPYIYDISNLRVNGISIYHQPAYIKCHKLHRTKTGSVWGFACVCLKHFGHNVMEIREYCVVVDGSDTPQRFVRPTF